MIEDETVAPPLGLLAAAAISGAGWRARTS